MTRRQDTNPQNSAKSGMGGLFEIAIRRFRSVGMTVTFLSLLLVVTALLGLSLVPAISLISFAFEWSEGLGEFPKRLVQGMSIVAGFLTFGFSGIVVVPLANRLVRPLLKPFRGPAYSAEVFGWYVHNILIYCLRYTFLDWITPSPFNIFFYRQMGMRIGKRAEINSSNISDAAYITLEDGVTIGGSATLIAHYAMGGYLVISPVIIRKNATIGLRAIIMGGVEIGEGAKVLPNSVVLPKSVIPAGETWAGIPAKRYESPA